VELLLEHVLLIRHGRAKRALVLQCNVKPSMHLQMEICSVQRNVISDQCARSIVILVLILLGQDRERAVLRDDGLDCHLRVS